MLAGLHLCAGSRSHRSKQRKQRGVAKLNKKENKNKFSLEEKIFLSPDYGLNQSEAKAALPLRLIHFLKAAITQITKIL